MERINKKGIKIVIVLSFISLLILNGCGAKRISTLGFEEVDAPDWVLKGSGAFEEGKEKVFYGIGSASGITNYPLLRTTSENRSRNEIAKVFEAYTASLMKDYMASTTAGDFTRQSEEQHVEQAIKTVTTSTLSGVEIIDHWEHPTQRILFSLARLNLDQFEQNIQRMKELNSKVRDYVRENAKRLHEELETEEDKSGER